jgi:hypothetical protein
MTLPSLQAFSGLLELDLTNARLLQPLRCRLVVQRNNRPVGNIRNSSSECSPDGLSGRLCPDFHLNLLPLLHNSSQISTCNDAMQQAQSLSRQLDRVYT